MIIQVKRHRDDKVFTNVMSQEEGIYEIHFCTSYTQVMVQEMVEGKLTDNEIICPPQGTAPNPVDLIATQEDDTGEFVEATQKVVPSRFKPSKEQLESISKKVTEAILESSEGLWVEVDSTEPTLPKLPTLSGTRRELPKQHREAVEKLLEGNDGRLEAIKHLRDLSGCGLKVCKQYVEQLEEYNLFKRPEPTETNSQAVEVGDIVESLADGGCCFNIGDRGLVESVDQDGDLLCDLSCLGNSFVYGDGKWYISSMIGKGFKVVTPVLSNGQKLSYDTLLGVLWYISQGMICKSISVVSADSGLPTSDCEAYIEELRGIIQS